MHNIRVRVDNYIACSSNSGLKSKDTPVARSKPEVLIIFNTILQSKEPQLFEEMGASKTRSENI